MGMWPFFVCLYTKLDFMYALLDAPETALKAFLLCLLSLPFYVGSFFWGWGGEEV